MLVAGLPYGGQAAEGPRPGGASLQHNKLDGALILVVEDEPLIALDISSSLRDAGAQVVQAANVESALAAIDRHRCSAAVVDYWLS